MISAIDATFGDSDGLTAVGVFFCGEGVEVDLALPVFLSSTGAGTLLPKPIQPETKNKVSRAVKRREGKEGKNGCIYIKPHLNVREQNLPVPKKIAYNCFQIYR